jgi:hypothetical protein
MNIARRLIATASVGLLLIAATPAVAESRASKGHSDGTFLEIEQGDYAHFVIKTKAGRESFFVLRPDKSVQSYIDNGAKLKGRKVRVHWEERSESIPEAGGKQRIKVVKRVDQRT